MGQYFGLMVAKSDCLRCQCGNSYEQILDGGGYCPSCGCHRSDIEESVFDQIELPKIAGRQLAAVDDNGEAWVVGFEVKDGVSPAELEGDDEARAGLRDWVKSVVGISFMLDDVAILQA